MGNVNTLLTFAEFEQLPEQPGKQELVRGELVEMAPAEYNHHLIADRIYDSLKSALAQAHARGEAGGLGRVFREMGYRLPGEGWLQPDVSVSHAGQRVEKYLIGPPLSPSK
jgi:Uma2 family endonuclease